MAVPIRACGNQPPPFTEDPINYSSNSSSQSESYNSDEFSSPPPPLESLLPATYRSGHNQLEPTSLSLEYLSAELALNQLEDFNRWLWLLSSPCLPRPLHDSAFLGRQICITESMDRHLGLGKTSHLYLKPIPRILLDPRFWRDYLQCPDSCHNHQGGELARCHSASHTHSTTKAGAKCPQRQLFECALGFLFSYTALLSHESDFHLAHKHHLLPASLTWEGWRTLARSITTYPNLSTRIHKRFLYGELRLHLLKEMAQLRRGALLRVLVGRIEMLARFFQTNVRWLASLVAYTAIVLTALQVGVATPGLMDSPPFQSFSYGFTVFSLVGPFGVVIAFALYFGLYILYYVALNLMGDAEAWQRRRQRPWQSIMGRKGKRKERPDCV